MTTEMDRTQLADFLRRSRERLRPQDVGLPEGPRRRTPGLRREEVALLSGMSADYYMRLEQARSPQPSVQVLSALARTLRLSDDERDHLYLLSGHRPPAGRPAGAEIRPALRHLLDQLSDAPAQVLSDLGDLLGQNATAEALFGCVCGVEGDGRNLIWSWFTNPLMRASYPPEEWQHYSRTHVADLRAATVRRGGDAASTGLVQRLLASSKEFAELWERHEVGVRRSAVLRVRHPQLGPVSLLSELLLTPSEDQRLLLFTAVPGSPDAAVLDRLREIGARDFADLH